MNRLSAGGGLVVGTGLLVACIAFALPLLLLAAGVAAVWLAGDALIALAKDANLEAKGWRKS